MRSRLCCAGATACSALRTPCGCFLKEPALASEKGAVLLGRGCHLSTALFDPTEPAMHCPHTRRLSVTETSKAWVAAWNEADAQSSVWLQLLGRQRGGPLWAAARSPEPRAQRAHAALNTARLSERCRCTVQSLHRTLRCCTWVCLAAVEQAARSLHGLPMCCASQCPPEPAPLLHSQQLTGELRWVPTASLGGGPARLRSPAHLLEGNRCTTGVLPPGSGTVTLPDTC